MPTLYWGPWLAKIRRGGPVWYVMYLTNFLTNFLTNISWSLLQRQKRIVIYYVKKFVRKSQ